MPKPAGTPTLPTDGSSPANTLRPARANIRGRRDRSLGSALCPPSPSGRGEESGLRRREGAISRRQMWGNRASRRRRCSSRTRSGASHDTALRPGPGREGSHRLSARPSCGAARQAPTCPSWTRTGLRGRAWPRATRNRTREPLAPRRRRDKPPGDPAEFPHLAWLGRDAPGHAAMRPCGHAAMRPCIRLDCACPREHNPPM